MSFTLHIHTLHHSVEDTPIEEIKRVLLQAVAELDARPTGEVLDSRGAPVGVFALGEFDSAKHEWVPDAVWATIRKSAEQPAPGHCRHTSQCIRTPGHTGPHIGSTGPAWTDVVSENKA